MKTATQTAEPAEQAATIAPLAPGDYVIVRCRDAGVHAGEYQGHNGREVTLTNSRRLWYWKAKSSISLSGVAQYGVNHDVSRIAPPLASTTLLEACEILRCTADAADSIQEAPVAAAR